MFNYNMTKINITNNMQQHYKDYIDLFDYQNNAK